MKLHGNLLIAAGVILVLAISGFFLLGQPAVPSETEEAVSSLDFKGIVIQKFVEEDDELHQEILKTENEKAENITFLLLLPKEIAPNEFGVETD